MTNPFTHYISLGDSISIDLYPALDAAERLGLPEDAPEIQRLGAASLFVENDSAFWPGWEYDDLMQFVPALERVSFLAEDGATTWDVLERQLPDFEPGDECTLVTLTAGGNDLLRMLGAGEGVRGREEVVRAVPRNLREIVRRLRARRPDVTIVLGTIYDPTDGTDLLPPERGMGRMTTEGIWLRETNEAIREIARETGVMLADIHRHFLGHGWQSEESWYWPGLVFEPSAKGASEVRRLWLHAVHEVREVVFENRRRLV